VVVTFRITRPEFMATWRRAHSRRPQTWITAVLTAAAWVFALWAMTGKPAGAAVFGIIYLPVYLWLTLVVAPRRHWSKNSELREERIQRFSKDGIEEKRDNAEAKVKWAYFSDAVRLGNIYVLRATRGRYTSVPRRALACPEDEARFRELVSVQTGSRL
jgi:hypothetical protein